MIGDDCWPEAGIITACYVYNIAYKVILLKMTFNYVNNEVRISWRINNVMFLKSLETGMTPVMQEEQLEGNVLDGKSEAKITQPMWRRKLRCMRWLSFLLTVKRLYLLFIPFSLFTLGIWSLSYAAIIAANTAENCTITAAVHLL